ncbi:hypothetical protein PJ985_10795 [Streptomyces sp. ACA25]|uniref:hypothetical protein n=1 Tax=Streptomyces sp. ACA25 TaxID=3022596 RepID=UPI0023075B22|nr:hypothetical protein [Streptomyces sp. ACA25]MDB1088052.1 hypothetical protein [Streptomyces sp. ACA25]
MTLVGALAALVGAVLGLTLTGLLVSLTRTDLLTAAVLPPLTGLVVVVGALLPLGFARGLTPDPVPRQG